MTTHRISRPNDCASAWRFSGQAYNPDTTEEASKLVLKPFGMPVYGEDYWVIYTDYTHHSLVYSCQERDEDGTCLGDASRAWLLSRGPTMPAAARSHMEMLLTEMCVDVGRLVDTPHECDEVLAVEILPSGSDANECVVNSFPTMQDFDKSQYVGTWYVASYLQDEVYPYQRISQYSLESDGSLTMTTDRVIRPTSCSSLWHFEATAAEREGSPASSKLLLKPRGMDVEAEDYWIVYTDYTDYALVYSCTTRNLDGTCLEGASHAWLLSRKPRLSDVAHSHMVSLLTDLCVDPLRLIDTPTDCDDELGVSEASRCDVSNFEVMEFFDPSQYVGPWYMISHLQDRVYPYHRISNYDLAEDGSIIMTTNRIVSPGECDSAKTFEVIATPSVVGGARMLLKPVGIPAGGEDYWVVYTDYVDHALVYSCGRRNLDGTCQEGATHAWMISRSPTLSQGARRHMEMLLGGLCIDPNRLVDTPSECDAVLETGLRRPVVELVARSCIVDEFQVMENFDIHQYAGQWYTVSQIQPFEYPFHRVSNYTMQENGRLLMSTDQFFRPRNCSTVHFEAEAFHEPTMQLAEGEQRNGKLFLDPVDDSIPPGSYWVIYANYSDHALVYSCLRRDEEGLCLRGYAMVWFMSRKPTLGQKAMNDMLSLLPNLCISPSLLRNVITECDEEIGIVSEQAPVPCAISNFSVKENFVIDKFMGDWYELSHGDSDVYMNVPDMEMISFGPPAADSDSDISVTMKNLRLNGVCSNKNMPGHGWLGRSEPAKFTLSFPLIPDGYDVPEVVNHWVLDTDYISYAITYTCHQIKPDGSCDPGSQGLWVLGRERPITPEFWITIQTVIKGACMRPRNIVPNPEPCPDYVPLERSQDDPRSCEQNVFGCCLLWDEAAIDGDFSNCPRVAPPVAGRLIPEAPVNIVDGTVHCEQHMNCKMFCRLGFKRDADNCEICECAVEPTSGTPPPISLSGECQTRYEQIMAKLKNNSPRRGFYVPNCDPQGNYFPLQCLYPQTACWCADPISGDRLSKARYEGNEPSCDL